jgi:hypothetical protein
MANDITLESLHNDIVALRHELGDLRQQFRIDLIRLEAKIDSKPSLMAMFAGIAVAVFGMAGVIASTVTTLHALNFFR